MTTTPATPRDRDIVYDALTMLDGFEDWDPTATRNAALAALTRIEAENETMLRMNHDMIDDLRRELGDAQDGLNANWDVLVEKDRQLQEAHAALREIADSHEHSGECYSNYNDPTMLMCGKPTPAVAHIARAALAGTQNVEEGERLKRHAETLLQNPEFVAALDEPFDPSTARPADEVLAPYITPTEPTPEPGQHTAEEIREHFGTGPSE